jgi:hypothetical protein
MPFKWQRYQPHGPARLDVPPLIMEGVERKKKTPWWKQTLKVVSTVGICFLVGRDSKLKPRDVTNGILIDLIYRQPITAPMAVLGIVKRRMVEAGLSKWEREQQEAYALRRIQAQM